MGLQRTGWTYGDILRREDVGGRSQSDWFESRNKIFHQDFHHMVCAMHNSRGIIYRTLVVLADTCGITWPVPFSRRLLLSPMYSYHGSTMHTPNSHLTNWGFPSLWSSWLARWWMPNLSWVMKYKAWEIPMAMFLAVWIWEAEAKFAEREKN